MINRPVSKVGATMKACTRFIRRTKYRCFLRGASKGLCHGLGFRIQLGTLGKSGGSGVLQGVHAEGQYYV